MQFDHGFSKQALIVTLVRILIWSLLNTCVLLFLRYLDHAFLVSENVLSILVIPVGLIEVAVLINGFIQLKRFYWKTLLISAVSIVNFFFFLFILQSLYSQSGSMAN
jgi:hypothetical protein